MKCADLPRRLFQVLPTASHRRPRRCRPAFECFEDRLLLSTYYVATTGSNSANGSATAPWATIQKAANTVAPGDTVYVAPGNYSAAVTTNTSGTAADPIKFISTVPWGANITSAGGTAWTDRGNYVVIQGFSFSGNSQCGINSLASYTQIIGNHVYNNQNGSYGVQGGAGIDIGNYPPWSGTEPTTGNLIIDNVVNNCGVPGVKSSSEGQGIYIADANDVVQNNIVYNNSGTGITTWHACTNVTISNNLVWGNLDCGIQIGAGNAPGGVVCNNSIVSNNISINNGAGLVEEGLCGANNVFLNNCVYGNTRGQISLELGHIAKNTVAANAEFVNWQADGSGDYHLAAGSPCINAGTSQGAAATDMDGVPRPQVRSSGNGYDIGPYEYQTSSDTTPLTVTSENPSTSSIGDPGFEQVVVGAGNFQYDPTGSPWAFSGGSGISGNNSGFTSGNPPAPQGSQVAFLQETGSFTQTVADWAAGSYVLTFDAAQRGNFGVSQQNFNVLIDGNIVGTFTPSGTSYQSYSTAVFTVTTAGPLTITFQGLDSAGGDNTAFIDGVSVS